MTSTTTTRYPIKVKSLTLLELCQTINDLRHATSRSTAQILTRRLYLHPLTISPNAKQQSSKLIANSLLKIEPYNQSTLDKIPSAHQPVPFRDLSILSSSLSLTTRSNSKINSSINTDNDDTNEYETSIATSSLNQLILPPVNRHIPPIPKKRTVSTRSLYVPKQRQMNSIQRNQEKHSVVWHQIDNTLDRPIPDDPPTTPLHSATDFNVQTVQELEVQQPPKYNSIREIKIYKRNLVHN